MKRKVLQSVLILSLLLTACSKNESGEIVPTETEEVILPEAYEETTYYLCSGKMLDSGLEYSISLDSTISFFAIFSATLSKSLQTLISIFSP